MIAEMLRMLMIALMVTIWKDADYVWIGMLASTRNKTFTMRGVVWEVQGDTILLAVLLDAVHLVLVVHRVLDARLVAVHPQEAAVHLPLEAAVHLLLEVVVLRADVLLIMLVLFHLHHQGAEHLLAVPSLPFLRLVVLLFVPSHHAVLVPSTQMDTRDQDLLLVHQALVVLISVLDLLSRLDQRTLVVTTFDILPCSKRVRNVEEDK